MSRDGCWPSSMPYRMVVMQRALFCFQCLWNVAYSCLLAFLLEVGGAGGSRLGALLLDGVLKRTSRR